MFKTILVPLDGSTLAERALPPAGELARRSGATIILARAPNREPAYANAESPYSLIYPQQAVGRASAEAETYLQSVRSQPATRGALVRTLLVEGEAADAIIDLADQTQADLIVMSSHGYTGLTRLLMGSVTEKVLQAARCPVLVVRSPRAIQHVLVTLDGSRLSECAIVPAIETALGFGASVTLLRVVPELHAGQLSELDEFETGLGPRLVEEVREDAQGYLQKFVSQYQGQGLQINEQVRSGPAASAILEYAASHAIDLIAMATHGRTGLQRWVYASVTDKVLHAADFSMLVVRPRPDSLN